MFEPANTRIVDTHIHLFDTGRPQGLPWPSEDDAILFQPALPTRFREVTKGLGIERAIAVECSPWLEDNQWVLDVAAAEPAIAGVVGNLEPGRPGFRAHLDRLQSHPLFVGIRYGNLWGRNLSEEAAKPDFISDLQALADAGLSLDTANPDPALIEAVVRITDSVPGLRIVIDHLPQLDPPSDSKLRANLKANLQELGQRPQVYVKISEVLRRIDGAVPLDANFYRQRLDGLWDIFGDDRLMYGSDWPNSDQWGTYRQVLSVARDYIESKEESVRRKFFRENSMAAYRLSL